MGKMNKEDKNSLLDIIGKHIGKYFKSSIVFLFILIVLIITTMVVWYKLPFDDLPEWKLIFNEVVFYILQGSLLLSTIINIIFIVLNHIGKITHRDLAIISHIYSFILITFGTLSFSFDVGLGFTSLLYLFILTFIAGLMVLEPIYFSVASGISIVIIIVMSIINNKILFNGELFIENVFNIAIFVLIDIAIAFKNFRVTMSEFKYNKKLEELSYKDQFTGLLNERSYVEEMDLINNRIKNGEDIHFAIMLMDVNNLKATNDMYGHRFGSELIKRCGHKINEIFKSSKLFHVCGDEFLVVIYGSDFDNFSDTIKRYDDEMLYSLFTFEGVELIFSVARGYAIYREGQTFKDVLQIADKAMYENKEYLKEKYHLKKR